MKNVSAVIGGFGLVLASLAAQAQEPAATAAPMSLLGNAPQHTQRGAAIPYTEPAMPSAAAPGAYAQGSASSQMATTPSDAVPAGMRISYKRAANGSFVKTYVRETGTN